MTPLEHALNEMNLEEIESDIPKDELLKEHWTLEYLSRLGRPAGLSYKTKKGYTNDLPKNE